MDNIIYLYLISNNYHYGDGNNMIYFFELYTEDDIKLFNNPLNSRYLFPLTEEKFEAFKRLTNQKYEIYEMTINQVLRFLEMEEWII